MEIMYLAEKKRIPLSISETYEKIDENPLYTVVDLTIDILQTAEGVAFYELHDRLILATAKCLEIPIISSDSKFKNLEDINVIWD